jgi:glycerol-3-phosphate dehydrogenase (NAD(P)+)
MNITVIGCGRWGTFIAWYLDKLSHDVTLYGRENSERMKELAEHRGNGLVYLSDRVNLTCSLSNILMQDVIVISIGSQNLQSLMDELAQYNIQNRIIVLCMKGLEADTGRRLSQVASAAMDPTNRIAVWLGPGHVQEFCKGIPNCMVIDSADTGVKSKLVDAFSSDLIRFYYGQDLIGNEIGAASKNVIGIAAGMLDGLHLSTLKGALMSRGTREIARLISAMGGSELSAYGLCHLGDYEATVFSPFSHNRKFGESYILHEDYAEMAEGFYAVKALVALGREYHVDLPICNAVYDVLYHGRDANTTLNELFTRSLKNEF